MCVVKRGSFNRLQRTGHSVANLVLHTGHSAFCPPVNGFRIVLVGVGLEYLGEGTWVVAWVVSQVDIFELSISLRDEERIHMANKMWVHWFIYKQPDYTQRLACYLTSALYLTISPKWFMARVNPKMWALALCWSISFLLDSQTMCLSNSSRSHP